MGKFIIVDRFGIETKLMISFHDTYEEANKELVKFLYLNSEYKISDFSIVPNDSGYEKTLENLYKDLNVEGANLYNLNPNNLSYLSALNLLLTHAYLWNLKRNFDPIKAISSGKSIYFPIFIKTETGSIKYSHVVYFSQYGDKSCFFPNFGIRFSFSSYDEAVDFVNQHILLFEILYRWT